MNDNVINFPKLKILTPPQTDDEVSMNLVSYRTSYANEIANYLTTMVLTELSRAGCSLADQEDIQPSIILINEAIRSLHLLTSEIDHPLQEYAATTYEGFQVISDYEDDDDEGEFE